MSVLHEFEAQAISTRDVAVVVITGYGFTVSGHAKRDPRDKPNREIGEALALARAYQALGHRLERQARGRIKHADDVEEMKKTQKQRPPKGRGDLSTVPGRG